MDIRFGRVTKETTTPTEDGTVTKTITASIHDFSPAGEKISFTERKKANEYQEIVGAALKFCERYKLGSMHEPSFTIRERGGKPAFVEISWTPKDK